MRLWPAVTPHAPGGRMFAGPGGAVHRPRVFCIRVGIEYRDCPDECQSSTTKHSSR